MLLAGGMEQMNKIPIVIGVLVMMTVCTFPTNPVSATNWHPSGSKMNLNYYDCSTNNYYGGFYLDQIYYNSILMIDLAYVHVIQFKFDGSWYEKSLDMDVAGHPSCSIINTTSGGYWTHGNTFHWNLQSGAKHAGVEYSIYIKVYSDGNTPKIWFYQRFNYTSTDGNIVTDFKTWWKYLPYVNGDSGNIVKIYNTTPPWTLTYEAKDAKSTWTDYRFIDSGDSSKYIYVYDKSSDTITSKWGVFLWPTEYDGAFDENDNHEKIQYELTMGSDYMALYGSATQGTTYLTWTEYSASWT
jgi:hypothetical protein